MLTFTDISGALRAADAAVANGWCSTTEIGKAVMIFGQKVWRVGMFDINGGFLGYV